MMQMPWFRRPKHVEPISNTERLARRVGFFALAFLAGLGLLFVLYWHQRGELGTVKDQQRTDHDQAKALYSQGAAAGVTPTVTPSGVAPATAIPGSPGAPGASGLPGPAGQNGQNGRNGVNGNNGVNGSLGPSGPSGPVGPTGPTGATGPAGPSGPSGPNGAAGPECPDGYTVQTVTPSAGGTAYAVCSSPLPPVTPTP